MDEKTTAKTNDPAEKAAPENASDLMKTAVPEIPVAPTVPFESAAKKGQSKSPFTPVLLGILLLVALVGGGFFYLSQKPSAPDTTVLAPEAAEPTETPAPLFLTLTSPTAQTKTVNGEILVSGTTLPGATVMIVTDSDETSVDSDSSGLFESSVYLGEKGGLLKVTAYSPAGEEKSETLSVSGGNL